MYHCHWWGVVYTTNRGCSTFYEYVQKNRVLLQQYIDYQRFASKFAYCCMSICIIAMWIWIGKMMMLAINYITTPAVVVTEAAITNEISMAQQSLLLQH